MVGLNSVGLCWCWKLGKCCRIFLVEATRFSILILPFPPLTFLHLDFHSKAKLVALSESIWMPPSLGVFQVHQCHPSKQLKLFFLASHNKYLRRELCLFAPTSAEQRLLSSSGSLWISTQTSPEHAWDVAEPDLCFLRNTSWGRWHPTVVPMVMAGLGACFTKTLQRALI